MTDRSPFDDDWDDEDPPGPTRARGAHFATSGDAPRLDEVDVDDEDYAGFYERGRRMGRRSSNRGGGGRRGLRIVLGVLVVGLLAVGAVGVWVQRQIDPSGAPGVVQSIEIPSGSTSSGIGHLLADKGVISSSFVWDWYLRIHGGGPFEAGLYDLHRNSSMGDVVDVLEVGPKPPDERTFTMPEGFTVAETMARLADPDKGLGFDPAVMQQLLATGKVRSEFQPADQTSSEGILFPETYRVGKDEDELAVLKVMAQELDSTLRGLDVAAAEERFHLTPYEILITASLIEEETKVPSERPMVARVIYNRIRQGIPLGIDATSRYEAEIEGRDRSKVDFTSKSPFNTRKSKGLPPTPIASPGRASIEAALNPADGPWIYYVLKDQDGSHFFTDSNSEFIAAKQRCKDAGLGCG